MAIFIDFIISIIQKLGYWGVFLGMVIESASIPLPSEIIMGYAGFMVHLGQFNIWIAILAGAFGNLTGSTILYLLGKYGGNPFLEKYGHLIRVKKHDLERAEKWFSKYGDVTVFFSQLLPVIRTFISFPAGVLEIGYIRFAIYTFTGALIWCTVLVFFAKGLGDQWQNIELVFKPFQNIIIVVCVIAIVVYVYLKLIRPLLARKKSLSNK